MPRYFKVGDRVRVTCTEKYKEDCSGWLGGNRSDLRHTLRRCYRREEKP